MPPSFSAEAINSAAIDAVQDEPKVIVGAANHLDVIPYKKDTEMTASSFINLSLFVVGLIGFFIFLFRNKEKLSKLGFLPLEQGKHIVVIDRQKLHADNFIYLIAIDGKQYLLTVGNASSNIRAIE